MSEISDDIEDADRRAARRGLKAQQELELLEESFATLKAAALEELVQTSPHQVEKRERLYLVAHVSESVKQALLRIATNGEVARQVLASEISLRP